MEALRRLKASKAGQYLDLEGGELRRSISWRQRLLKGTSVLLSHLQALYNIIFLTSIIALSDWGGR